VRGPTSKPALESRALRYFVAVAEERNFSRAADRLGMSAPPLSRAIRAFEADLGVTLLERDTHGVALTRPAPSCWTRDASRWRRCRPPGAGRSVPARPRRRWC
jgi:hypothetical protein